MTRRSTPSRTRSSTLPYDEPQHHWHIEEGKQPEKREGRRPASYFFRVPERAARGRKAQGQVALFEETPRARSTCSTSPTCSGSGSQDWRERDYQGATKVTRELLDLWRSPDRAQPLFYAQLEAAETVMFLVEGPADLKQGINGPDGRAGRGREGGGLQGVPALRAQDGHRHRQDHGDGDAGGVVDPQQGGGSAGRRSTPTPC